MQSFAAYIPIDRLHAVACGEALPPTATGAALFADISGFTPLTEALVRLLGPRQGAEEMARRINTIFNALIDPVHRFRGSVIGFSGDALTCWFDRDDSSRAVAAALAMQAAMAEVGALTLASGGLVIVGLKVSIAHGSIQRFVVGDPDVQLHDIIAGDTLTRLADADHLARRGEIVLSPECWPAVADTALLLEWRAADSGDSPQRYPIIGGLLQQTTPAPWPDLPAAAIEPAALSAWLPPDFRARVQELGHEPAPELRPVAVVFLHFGGIDYDRDPDAGKCLDSLARAVQAILRRYGGTLTQLTIGEKGSFLMALFGAPIAHEDVAVRAAYAAIAIRDVLVGSLRLQQIALGISMGTVWAGAYGGQQRRTYSVLGDEVNFAARLMQRAAPGEILASGRVQQAARGLRWEQLPPVTVKGKREPMLVSRLVGMVADAPASQAALSSLIGRRRELDTLLRLTAPLCAGAGMEVIVVVGEAGVGKSRLTLELRAQLVDHITWLTCPAENLIGGALHPLRNWLSTYIPASAAQANEDRYAALIATLAHMAEAVGANDPELAAALERAGPFIAAVVGLTSGDGQVGLAGSPEVWRQRTLDAIVAILRAECRRQPVLLHLEDAHWLDADSRALVVALVERLDGLPFGTLITCRPQGTPLTFAADVACYTLDLAPLDQESSADLAAQLLGASLDPPLAALLMGRTEGNPFFLEQLVYDLRERRVLYNEGGCWQLTSDQEIDIPPSVGAALLARIDRLPAAMREVLQNAAVLGVEFELATLAVMQGTFVGEQLRQALAEGLILSSGQGRFRFRHALLRDTAYQMQTSEQLRRSHCCAAEAIEGLAEAASVTACAELAYHYGRAEEPARERHYLLLVGEQAFHSGAFHQALGAFARALVRMPADDPQRSAALAQQARVHAYLGDLAAADDLLAEALRLAEQAGDQHQAASVAYERGGIAYRRGAAPLALTYLERSLDLYRALDDRAGLGRALNLMGGIWIELGDTERALTAYEEALSLR